MTQDIDTYIQQVVKKHNNLLVSTRLRNRVATIHATKEVEGIIEAFEETYAVVYDDFLKMQINFYKQALNKLKT